ncbi:MAG: glycosyltransferase family 39 protein [Desulfobulbales bacterium]|nr:glycosyltransferase family 39 protein [Desulfobulbales bacterium]
MGKLKAFESILLFSVVLLLVFPILYICRVLDNNTLVSWRWVFDSSSVAPVFIWLLAAVVFAGLISLRLPLEKFSSPVLFVLAVLMILPLWSEPELLLDSGRYFIQAKHLSEYGLSYFIREWGREIPAWTDLPLIPFLYGLIFKIAGETRVAIQCFNTILFGLTLVVTARIGEELWDKETGFYAGLLLLGMPYLLTQVPLMLVDIPVMFFLALALYVFLLAIARGGWWIGFSILTNVLALLGKYSIWPMLLVLPLSALVYWNREDRAVLNRAGVVLSFSAALLVVLITLNFELFQGQLDILLNYQRPALKLWQEGYWSTFFFQISPLVSFLAVWAAYRAYRTGDRYFLITAFFAVMVFGLQMKRIRYIIPLLPLLALMASFGLQAIREKQVRRFAGLIIISYSLIIVNVGYLPFFRTTGMMNIMQAGRFLDSLPGETVEVYALPQSKSGGNTVLAIPQLDLFTHKKMVSRQDWITEQARRQPSLAPLLFSWKIGRPSFYTPDPAEKSPPLVVIFDDSLASTENALGSVIGARSGMRQFVSESGVFRFKTNLFIFF